ncbi:MAG: hypothetical protein OIF50_11495 [Flavobacteriaceae bacterium]|nr:hypothetical protein [Flavobacteriaceae bacterium]
MKQLQNVVMGVLLVFGIHSVTAQKIKVKKDKVLYDGVAVAVASGSGYSFTYTSLDGSIEIKVTSDGQGQPEGHVEMLTIKDVKQDRTRIIPMEFLSITMSRKKAIAELLTKKYDFINSEGFANVDAFFNEQKSAEQKAKILASISLKELNNVSSI